MEEERRNCFVGFRTDSDGRYNVIHLRPGTYEVEVKQVGFATLSQTSVVVEGRVTPVVLKLALAGAETALLPTRSRRLVALGSRQPSYKRSSILESEFRRPRFWIIELN